MIHKSKKYKFISGGRTGTVYTTKEHFEEVFGPPQIDEPGDDKVTFIHCFITPIGYVHVRDYWWNKNNELSVSAETKAAQACLGMLLKQHDIIYQL